MKRMWMYGLGALAAACVLAMAFACGGQKAEAPAAQMRVLGAADNDLTEIALDQILIDPANFAGMCFKSTVIYSGECPDRKYRVCFKAKNDDAGREFKVTSGRYSKSILNGLSLGQEVLIYGCYMYDAMNPQDEHIELN